MDTSKLTADTLKALSKRAGEELHSEHPLRQYITRYLPAADRLQEQVSEAWAAQTLDGFTQTLMTEDREIYEYFYKSMAWIESDEFLDNMLTQHFGEGENIAAIKERAEELRQMHQSSTVPYKDAMRTFVQRTMEAKKQIFSTPEGRELILKTMDEQLASHNEKWGIWFSGALKGADTIPKIIYTHMSSPHNFTSALEGSGHNHSLNTLINQARELAYLEGKPLSEIMPARLKMVGLTDFQTELFTNITKAYEQGTHREFTDNLWVEHEAAIELLQQENAARISAATERLEQKAAATAEETPGVLRQALGAAEAEAKASVSSALSNVGKQSEGWMAWLGRNKLPVGAGVAIAAAAGGWALYEASKRHTPEKESDTAAAKTL